MNNLLVEKMAQGNKRLMRVEELNTEGATEPTVEEKTQAFEDWVNGSIAACERIFFAGVQVLEHWLDQRELIGDRLFDSMFESQYSYINDSIEIATQHCEDNGIAADVLENAITRFKQMKSEVRKTKTEYKREFAELRGAIAESLMDEEYVANITASVESMITDWCSTYAIKEYREIEFEGACLKETSAYLTRLVMQCKLNPSKQEVGYYVKNYMVDATKTIEC